MILSHAFLLDRKQNVFFFRKEAIRTDTINELREITLHLSIEKSPILTIVSEKNKFFRCTIIFLPTVLGLYALKICKKKVCFKLCLNS